MRYRSFVGLWLLIVNSYCKSHCILFAPNVQKFYQKLINYSRNCSTKIYSIQLWRHQIIHKNKMKHMDKYGKEAQWQWERNIKKGHHSKKGKGSEVLGKTWTSMKRKHNSNGNGTSLNMYITGSTFNTRRQMKTSP